MDTLIAYYQVARMPVSPYSIKKIYNPKKNYGKIRHIFYITRVSNLNPAIRYSTAKNSVTVPTMQSNQKDNNPPNDIA